MLRLLTQCHVLYLSTVADLSIYWDCIECFRTMDLDSHSWQKHVLQVFSSWKNEVFFSELLHWLKLLILSWLQSAFKLEWQKQKQCNLNARNDVFFNFSSSSLHFLHHFLPCGNSHKLKINFFATRGTGLTFGFTAKMLLYYFFSAPCQRSVN